MPTNDDTPIIPVLDETTLNDVDLIQVYDVSAGQVKAITYADLVTAITASQA